MDKMATPNQTKKTAKTQTRIYFAANATNLGTNKLQYETYLIRYIRNLSQKIVAKSAQEASNPRILDFSNELGVKTNPETIDWRESASGWTLSIPKQPHHLG